MQRLWNHVDRGNLNTSRGKKSGPEKFARHKSRTDWNIKAIIRSKYNRTTVHFVLN